MAEISGTTPPMPPLEVNPDEWLELVNGVRALPVVSPDYLTGTLGYTPEAANALFAELQEQHIVSKEEKKGLYAVAEPEQFRRIRIAAGQVAVGSVVESTWK